MKVITFCQKIVFLTILFLIAVGLLKTAAYILPALILLAAAFAFLAL